MEKNLWEVKSYIDLRHFFYRKRKSFLISRELSQNNHKKLSCQRLDMSTGSVIFHLRNAFFQQLSQVLCRRTNGKDWKKPFLQLCLLFSCNYILLALRTLETELKNNEFECLQKHLQIKNDDDLQLFNSFLYFVVRWVIVDFWSRPWISCCITLLHKTIFMICLTFRITYK